MAIKLFEKLIENNQDDSLLLWLFNYCYMTLGEFPNGVPEHLRLKTNFIDSFYSEIRKNTAVENADIVFVDRGHELGVDTFNAGKGAVVEDFDGDGDLRMSQPPRDCSKVGMKTKSASHGVQPGATSTMMVISTCSSPGGE